MSDVGSPRSRHYIRYSNEKSVRGDHHGKNNQLQRCGYGLRQMSGREEVFERERASAFPGIRMRTLEPVRNAKSELTPRLQVHAWGDSPGSLGNSEVQSQFWCLDSPTVDW